MKKILILFGASGDLGKTAAEYFLEQNYDFRYYFARRDFLQGIKSSGYQAIKTGDLSDEASVKESFARIAIDDASYFLLNAVGGYTGGKPIAETDYSAWRKMMNINLDSAFLISKYFAQLAGRARGGSICFVSALSSLSIAEGNAAYVISKSSMNTLVKILALEGRKTNISSNAVAPFAIDTPSNREWMKDQSLLVSKEKICGTVQFLFENYSTISGNIIELP
jgi:NAD(P)-dependent dehydrogenase (short-subunit alcohol dehydrogenase family)